MGQSDPRNPSLPTMAQSQLTSPKMISHRHHQSDMDTGRSGSLYDMSSATGLVSFKRFKNTAVAASSIVAANMRKSYNNNTDGGKRQKEMSDLAAERRNIEHMIVNSKFWSPSREFSGEDSMSHVAAQINLNETFTSNVFKDKREELTRILKKRLNYIHHRSHNTQQTMLASESTKNSSAILTTPNRSKQHMSPRHLNPLISPKQSRANPGLKTID